MTFYEWLKQKTGIEWVQNNNELSSHPPITRAEAAQLLKNTRHFPPQWNAELRNSAHPDFQNKVRIRLNADAVQEELTQHKHIVINPKLMAGFLKKKH
jgi:hypothetical protein